VLTIFTVDEELKRRALPFVDMELKRIDWDGVLNNDYGGGHSAAIKWSQAVWGDLVPEGADLFCRAFAMDNRLQRAVLKALAVRWGLAE
jgi:hypothetical protein